MKKSLTTASPFLMLLVPVFFCIALLVFNRSSDISSKKAVTGPAVKLPNIHTLVKALH